MPQAENERYLWSESANAALASMFKLFLGCVHKIFGRAIATAIYNWSTTDNFNISSVGYVAPPVTPSSYVSTPPNFPTPVGPFLGESRPFLEYSLTALAPPLPVPFSEDTSSGFYKAAKEVYDPGKNLTDAQLL